MTIEMENGEVDPRYLEYDGDLADPDQRCQHGTFIGSPWGPDYMCGLCEMGYNTWVEVPKYELYFGLNGLADLATPISWWGQPDRRVRLRMRDWFDRLAVAFADAGLSITVRVRKVRTGVWVDPKEDAEFIKEYASG